MRQPPKLKYRKEYYDGAVIEYDALPPNFRPAVANELGMVDTCGSCKFLGNMRSEYPVCTKYPVRYHGTGCLAKTICDDFKDALSEYGLF